MYRKLVAIGVSCKLCIVRKAFRNIPKATMLKKGTHVYWGKKFCANMSAMGETTQDTFCIDKRPFRTAALTCLKDLAPAKIVMTEI